LARSEYGKIQPSLYIRSEPFALMSHGAHETHKKNERRSYASGISHNRRDCSLGDCRGSFSCSRFRPLHENSLDVERLKLVIDIPDGYGHSSSQEVGDSDRRR